MAKGGDFERETCKQLGLWWTNGKRDDVFWRSSNSGGRATIRGRQGKATFGHAGDVAAVDPVGAPLLDLAAIELKRGYTGSTFGGLLDINRKSNVKQDQFEAWIQQAHASHVLSGSYSWMILARRNKREAVVFMHDLLADVVRDCIRSAAPRPYVAMAAEVRFLHPITKTKSETSIHRVRFAAMKWQDWLDCVSPEFIRKAVRKL